MAAALIGRDTVRLVFRDPVIQGGGVPLHDILGRPVYAERVVEKTGAKFTIESVAETDTVPPRAVYTAKAALPVDADTRALTCRDAVEHDGKRFELAGDARVKTTLIGGAAHHVRIRCSREELTGAGAELVVITPRGGQDDDGHRLPDGAPVTVQARAVDAGNTAARYGAEGTSDEADFTVVLPLGTGIRDGDWIRVRGRDCVARVQREFSQHADRNQDVVLARSRTGGG